MSAKTGFCWHCGALTAFKCARCEKWVCVVYGSLTPNNGCARLVQARKLIGVYRLVCWPRCIKRRNPATLDFVTRRMREGGYDGPAIIDPEAAGPDEVTKINALQLDLDVIPP